MKTEFERPGSRELRNEWILCIIIGLVLIALAGAAVFYAGKAAVAGISYAMERQAVGECEKWQDWERIYPEWDERTGTGYFITPWQKQQCDSVGVTLEAHVLDYKN